MFKLTHNLHPKGPNPSVRLAEVLVVGAALLLTGCGPKRLRVDFSNYENSFAVTSNREVLLNLARLQQHDPTYFFKLGQISSSYRMEASLTGTGGISPVSSPPATGIATGNGTAPLLYENDPSFSFIPVSDQTNAQLLLQPVDEKVFYSLFQQGWRIDQLFRLLVDHIVVTLPPDPASQNDMGCRVEVIRNAPPPSFYGTDFSQSAADIDRYVVFLRFSAVVYALQKHGLLLLRGTSAFQSSNEASFIPNPSAINNEEGTGQKTDAGGNPPANGNTSPSHAVGVNQGGSGGDAAGKSPQLPTAKDFDDAAAKGQSWVLEGADANNQGGDWVLGQNILDPTFQLNTMEPDAGAPPERVYGQRVKTVEDKLRTDLLPNDPSLSSLTQAPELTDILETLSSGFTLSGPSDIGTVPCTGRGPAGVRGIVTTHLVLRSLLGVMAAAAQEQAFYDALAKSGQDPQVPMEKDDLIYRIHAGQLVAQGLTQQQDDPAEIARIRAVSGMTFRFSELVPPIERLPVLRLSWPAYVKPPMEHLFFNPKERGLGVDYGGKEYVIADVDPEGVNSTDFARENETWNHDMFRLINELSSEVSVDISKFPLPEVVQLRTE